MFGYVRARLVSVSVSFVVGNSQQWRSVWRREDKPVLCQVDIFDAEFIKDFQTLALISSKKETLVT